MPYHNNSTPCAVETVDPKVETRLVECAIEGSPAIETRLEELDHEWSRNRVLEAIVAATALIGLALAYFVSPWGFMVVAIAGLILLQHALTRQSVLNSLLRFFGWRSTVAREQERSMLKAIRGDFDDLPVVVEEEDRAAIARLEEEGGVVDGPDIPVPVDHQAIREVIVTVRRGCNAR